MKLVPGLLAGLFAFAHLALPVYAEKLLQANYVTSCSDDSAIKTNEIKVKLLPDESQVWLEYDGTLDYDGYVMFNVDIFAYGYNITRQTVDPCDLNIANLCPMTSGKMPVPWNPMEVSKNTITSFVPSKSRLGRGCPLSRFTDDNPPMRFPSSLILDQPLPTTSPTSIYLSELPSSQRNPANRSPASKPPSPMATPSTYQGLAGPWVSSLVLVLLSPSFSPF